MPTAGRPTSRALAPGRHIGVPALPVKGHCGRVEASFVGLTTCIHSCSADCINPGTVHRHAIQNGIAEGRIDTGGVDLIGGLPVTGFISGAARPEAPWRIFAEGTVARTRRADVVFELQWIVVAVEFIRTSELDHAKLRDYRWLAADLAERGRTLLLLVVHLWPDPAAFRRWDRATWRDYFLSKAPRRWIPVPKFGPGWA